MQFMKYERHRKCTCSFKDQQRKCKYWIILDNEYSLARFLRAVSTIRIDENGRICIFLNINNHLIIGLNREILLQRIEALYAKRG